MLKTFKHDGAKQYIILLAMLFVLTTTSILWAATGTWAINFVFVEVFIIAVVCFPSIFGYIFLKSVMNGIIFQPANDMVIPNISYMYYTLPQKNSVIIAERLFSFAIIQIVTTAYGVLNMFVIWLVKPAVITDTFSDLVEEIQPLIDTVSKSNITAAVVLLIMLFLLTPYSAYGAVILANAVSQKHYNQKRINRSFILTILLIFITFVAILILAFVVGFITGIMSYADGVPLEDAKNIDPVLFPLVIGNIVLALSAVIYTAMGLKRFNRKLNIE
jgi:hypothetical protein